MQHRFGCGRVIEFSITGIGICGPGLKGWDESAKILRGETPYVAVDTEIVSPTILSPLERRRASNTVKMALGVAQEAVERIGADPAQLPAIFASSQGESHVTHQLLEALAKPDPVISPTKFHNSVHNTAAGYWTIVVGSHASCDSLAAGQHTFGAALLKAAANIEVEGRAILLVVFDAPFPEPMHLVYPMGSPFAAAMVIEPAGAANPICRVACSQAIDATPDPWTGAIPELNSMLANNPAGQSLAVLEAIAVGKRTSIALAHAGDCAIELDLQPCLEGQPC